jgi:hypothetical protein
MSIIRRTLQAAIVPTCLAALLVLEPHPSAAATIVYSGDPSAAGPSGYAVNSTYAEESSWTSLNSYTDVSVSFSSGYFSADAYPGTGTAYLTTEIGPNATSSTLIASTDFNFLNTTGGNVNLFSGLSLGPGTYYLVLAAPTGWGGGWSITTGTNEMTAPGVTLGESTFSYLPSYLGNLPSYAPSYRFGAFQYNTNVFSVDGNLVSNIAPEPSTLGFAGMTCLMALCVLVVCSRRARCA